MLTIDLLAELGSGEPNSPKFEPLLTLRLASLLIFYTIYGPNLDSIFLSNSAESKS
jgi:hypothetical protein